MLTYHKYTIALRWGWGNNQKTHKQYIFSSIMEKQISNLNFKMDLRWIENGFEMDLKWICIGINGV